MSEVHDHAHEEESWASLRVKALESLLVEKGLISSDSVDGLVEAYEQDIGPMNCAKVVARAWTDPGYKQRLLEHGTETISELGFLGREGSDIVVLENTPTVHNMVVCTLCSCYPWPVLGLPPSWYKSEAYRSRAVIEPRAVLQDFGLELEDGIVVRVWDSTADLRYMVLPERPEGSEGMTRDSMIGVAKAGQG